ncbi:phage tail tube protein [Shewanella submarina]|uniref:Phage tail tube protein n=1 Tax=Shewanella submarina TaxID=2016376 RepID=A0ABV7G7J2_9GAMM|nr:phage tail tube protein [Shewanella submarina]MCL1038338.1 phage tail tube protein [Shewanella submarina]
MLVARQAILLKIEDTYRDDKTVPTPGTDALLVNTIALTNANQRMIERPVVKPTLDPLQQVFGGTMQQVQFTVEVKGSGTAGTAPEIGQALQCCGYAEKVNATTSVEYSAVSTDHASCTIYLYQDGVLRVLRGCRGTVSFTANTGELLMADFTFTGHIDTPSDASPSGLQYHSTVPNAVIGLAGFKLNDGAADKEINVGSFTVDTANNIVTPANIKDPQGYGEVLIQTRDINGSIDPELMALATNDFADDWMKGKTYKLNSGDIGGTAGNKVSFALPKIAIRDVAPAERDGMITETVTFGAHEGTGEDASPLVITFA